MRAAEFTSPEPRRRFADGYLEFSDHFEQRLRERNIKKEDVIRMLDRLERTRSIDLIKMPFINFLVKSPNLDLAISKQLDNRNRTAYIIATTRSELRGGEDEDVIYLEGEEQLDELDFMGMSQCTKDCSGHEAGYAWSKARGGAHAASWSPSFNKGAEIAAAGY